MGSSLHSALVGVDLHIAKFRTGSGSPIGSATPSVIGEAYTDLITGITYVANGLTTSSWMVPTEYAGLTIQSVVNANFDIATRGTSFTNPASAAYTLDDWRNTFTADTGTFPTLVHTQQTLTSGDIPNAFYFYRIAPNGAGTTGAGQYYFTLQKIENGTRFMAGAGKKVTISFWARSSIAGKRLGIDLIQEYGAGGSPVNEVINGTYWTLTTTWTKYTYTFTTNTLVGKTFGTNNDDGLTFEFWSAWGSTFISRVGAPSAETFVGAGNIDIAQVEFCSGDAPIAFQPKRVVEEEFACQRYNYRVGGLAFTFCGMGYVTSATTASIFIPMPRKMRVVPALTNAGNFRVNSIAVTAIAIDTSQSRADGVVLTVTVAAGLTVGQSALLQANNDTTAYLNFDASF